MTVAQNNHESTPVVLTRWVDHLELHLGLAKENLPYVLSGCGGCVVNLSRMVEDEGMDEAEAESLLEYIRVAVNSHASLLAACKDALAFNTRTDMSLPEHVSRGAELNAQLRAAIASVEGGA